MEIIMSSRPFIIFLWTSFMLGSSQALSPVIVKEPNDVAIVQGGDVVLECVVENLPVEKDVVQWTKSGFALGFDRDLSGIPRYSMVGDESIGQYNLQILNTTLDDEGDYECQVTMHMMRTRTAKLEILVPPQGPKVDNIQEGTDDVINVLADAENLITCRSWNGKPAAKLEWFKDGEPLDAQPMETDATAKLKNSSATLRLWPTEHDDNSRYECVMTVDPAFENIGSSGLQSRTAVQLNVQKPPIAAISLSSTDLKEGSTLYASCDSSHSKPPATSYLWYLGGVVIKGEKDSRFTFYNVNRTMNGVGLECQSVNSVGKSKKSRVELNVLYPPMLVTAPQNITTNVSATVDLTCMWESNPKPSITWYHKNAKDDVTWVGDGEKLTVEVVDQSASGLYTCVADAKGVGSESVSSRIDVLGPPVFISDPAQSVTLGGKGKVACKLGSKPGISNVWWSWDRDGTTTTLRNNETVSVNKNGKKSMKYSGEVVKGESTAYLVIYDVSKDDLIQYNCTVMNAYGTGSDSITLEEAASQQSDVMIGAIVGAVVGSLVFLVLVIMFCVCYVMRRRQQKSTTFPPEEESLHEREPSRDTQEDQQSGKYNVQKKLVSQDADSDNPSSAASLSSRDGAVDSLALVDYRHGSAHNDDGYHTEEANSWNKHEKQSPESSPTRSAHDDYVRNDARMVPSSPLTSSPRSGYERAYANSDVGSDKGSKASYLRYLQPNYDAYGPNGVVDLPPPRNVGMSPVNMYVGQQPYSYYQGPPSSSSGYRSAAYPPSYLIGGQTQRPRAGSTTPSVISSHRSVTPAPYQTALGRSTPISVFADRGLYAHPVVAQSDQPDPLSSSQSSLDRASSSMVAVDPYENAAKMSQISSRVSQASRSSELIGNRQLTARMATNV